MRIFHISTIFLFLLTSTTWGLGLGDIEVRSAFTKKFEAVIPVALQDDDGELDVEIGKGTDYQLMQLARPEFIDWLLLTVEPDPEEPGGRIIVITSPKPIYRPSFNLVIRASAGGGTVMENYLLAVDFRKSLVIDLPEPQEEEEESVGVATGETVLPRPPPVAVAPVVAPSIAPVAVPDKMDEEPVAVAEAVEEKEPFVVVVKKVETVEKPKSVKKPQKPSPQPKRIVLPPKKVEMSKALEVPKALEAPEVVQATEAGQKISGGREFIKLNPDIFKNRRVVQSGDTLYGIARKLGASRKDRPAVVVAIYLENEHAFVNGNINRLISGAKLNYSRVNEFSASVTSFDARAFIERQFAQWKSRKRVPIRIENLAMSRIAFRDVLLFLENWKGHWAENNMKTLAGDYANNFRDRRGRNKTRFLDIRKRFNNQHPNIKLLFENIAATRMGKSVSVTFTQLFSSDNYSSMGRKRLALKPSFSGLKIMREEFTLLKQSSSGKHAWVVHLASYRGKATVKAHIGRLQSAGFTAFEAFALHPDGNQWYRLMVGRAGGREQARRLASELRKAGEPYTAVLELPFALEVAVYDDYEESLGALKTLSENGLSPYLVETVDAEGKARYAVYAGAFATDEEAETTREMLMKEGMEARITTP